MGIDTTIPWSDSTLNLMMGCDGCELWNPTKTVKKCYAGNLVTRYKGNPGWPDSFDIPKLFTERLPKALKWPDLTGEERPDKPWLNGYPRVIFHGDLGDYWTESLPIDWLAPHVLAMATSPHIHLFLTKQPNRMFQFWNDFMAKYKDPVYGPLPKVLPQNFWFLTTVTTQEKCWRLKHLAKMRTLGASVLGISYEPALGPVDWEYPKEQYPDGPPMCCNGIDCGCQGLPTEPPVLLDFDWLIVGGASGTNADPFEVDWAVNSLRACRSWGRRCFVKQVGSRPRISLAEDYLAWPEHATRGIRRGGDQYALTLKDRKGEDMSEWPKELRVRQMPEVRS